MSELILTPKQQAAVKFIKERFHETTTLEEIYVAGWDMRDAVLASVIFEDKQIDMTDTFEVALSSFTSGYARGLKEKETI